MLDDRRRTRADRSLSGPHGFLARRAEADDGAITIALSGELDLASAECAATQLAAAQRGSKPAPAATATGW